MIEARCWEIFQNSIHQMSSREGPLGSILTAKKNCKKTNWLLKLMVGWQIDRQKQKERQNFWIDSQKLLSIENQLHTFFWFSNVKHLGMHKWWGNCSFHLILRQDLGFGRRGKTKLNLLHSIYWNFDHGK